MRAIAGSSGSSGSSSGIGQSRTLDHCLLEVDSIRMPSTVTICEFCTNRPWSAFRMSTLSTKMLNALETRTPL